MAVNPEKNGVDQGFITKLIGIVKRKVLDLSGAVSDEETRAMAAEAAAKTVVTAGENCTIEMTTAADGHDVYTVNADGKPQVQSDWNQADSSKVDFIKNKPNLGLKADKVQGATAGNLAALDANGNLADSGKKTADFKTKQTAVSVTGGSLKGVASMSQNANGEVTLTLNDIQDGTTAQKGVVRLNNAIDSTSTTEAATPKAVKDAYDDLNNKIVARAVFLSQAEWAVQSQIPGDPAKVYYVEDGTGEDAYTVYVWKESTSEYVEVDESSIDLDGYWHDGPNTTGNGNVVTDISLGNDGVPQVVKGITALTQHQSVTDSNPTLAWGSTSTVGTVGGTNLQVTMPSNPASGKQDTVSTDTDSSAFGDNTTIVTGFGSNKLHLNIASRLWTYIQGKISSVLGLTSSSYGGKASTAGTADSANSVAWSKVSSRPTKLSDFTDDITQQSYIASGTGSDKPASGAAVAKAVSNRLVRVSPGDCAYGNTLLFTATMDSSNKGFISFVVSATKDVQNVKIIFATLGINYSGEESIKAWFITLADSESTRFKLAYKYIGQSGSSRQYEIWLIDTYSTGSASRRVSFTVINQNYLNSVEAGNSSQQSDVAGLTDFSQVKQVYTDGQKGSTSTPVYVDANGQVQPCNPSMMTVGWASNVNLSKTINAVSGDSIQAGTGASVTIGNAGNAKTWDSWKIAVDTFGTATDTIYFY